MLSRMATPDRFQPLRAAALVAAAMLLTVALAAASGVPTQGACQGTCPALRCGAVASATFPAGRIEPADAQAPVQGDRRVTSPASRASVAAPAAWRTLDLPPPTR